MSGLGQLVPLVLIIFLGSTALNGCEATDNPATDNDVAGDNDISDEPDPSVSPGTDFRTLANADNAPLEVEAQKTALTTAAAYHALWARLHAEMIPMPTAPEVDFSRETVLVAVLGERNTGGHDIEILSYDKRAASVAVQVRQTRPGNGCLVTEALTNPYHLVALPVAGLPVSFTTEDIVYECE